MKLDLSFLHRKKRYNEATLHETNLDRVLGLVDITALGVSCTLGNGIYVLAGDVIANYAGASIVLSFIVAGFATFIAGICYAEFGARVPRSGSAYVYIYVSIGEFVAFILGWDLILEYVIGVSSGASALSRYIDSMAGNVIQKSLRSSMPMNYESLAPYPDFLSFGFVILITIFMIVGVKESSLLNKLFTLLNIVVIAFIFVSGVFKADLTNWQLDPKTIPNWTDTQGNNQSCQTSSRCGNGGFLTYGFSGVIQGAAKCFYAYIGFDAIASTGEEVQNPKRNLPLSIVLTLVIVSLCYCSVSVVLTLMLPYYLIDPEIPLPQAYEYVGMGWAQTLVSVGAIASLITCLYASMFPMPRVVYSLASDGLIFKWLSILMPRLKTPVTAALASGLFAAILSLIFDLNQLIDMMSIGTLMAYSVVAVCVLILRYRPPVDEISEQQEEAKKMLTSSSEQQNHVDILVSTNRAAAAVLSAKRNRHLVDYVFGYSDEPLMKRFFKPGKKCNEQTSRLVNVLALLSVVYVFFMSLLLTIFQNSEQLEQSTEYMMMGVTALFFALTVVNSIIISQQPQDETIHSFKIPLISFLPFVSVFINLYLMMALSLHTWIRFAVWFLLGIVVYFSYGVRNSLERQHVVKLKDTNPS